MLITDSPHNGTRPNQISVRPHVLDRDTLAFHHCSLTTLRSLSTTYFSFYVLASLHIMTYDRGPSSLWLTVEKYAHREEEMKVGGNSSIGMTVSPAKRLTGVIT